ncbi:hypothetical protein BH10CYA1_BH10CYA1_34840 [soil metagenome]
MTETVDALFKPDDKKTHPDEKKVEPTIGTSTAPRVGDTGHHDTSGGGAHDTPEDAFRAAIGLESGNKGNTAYTTEQFNRELGQGAGVSRGQNVKFTDANGQEIQGGQYHNAGGTFFKTAEGEKYRVDQEAGKYTLQPTREGQKPIEATQREVMSDSFSPVRNRNRDNDGGDGSRTRPRDGDGDGSRTRPRDGDGDGSRTRPRDGDAGDGANGTRTRPNKDGEPIVAAVAPAVAEKVVPPVTTDKTAPVVPVATTAGGDHTPVAPNAAAITAAAITAGKLDPTLTTIPREQRRESLTQVAELAIKSDKPGAVTPSPVKVDGTPVVAAPQIKDLIPPKDNSGFQPGTLGGKDRSTGDGNPVIRANQGDGNPVIRANQGDGTPQIIKPGGAVDPSIKIVTSVEGAIIKDGRGQMPGGDSFKPDGGNRGGQGQLDPAVLIAKLQNPGGQPGDRTPLGADGKPFQPVQLPPDLTRGHGPGDGKDNPGAAIQAAVRGLGGDQPQPVVPQPKNMIPGLDLNDPQTRQFLADALKQIQATKVGDFDPRNQNQNLQDILKGFDPHKIDRLQAFLNPDGKGAISDAAVGKLAAVLNPAADRVTGSAATDMTLGQKTAIDRLTELVRGNQNLIDSQTLQTKDARLLQEINRVVGDVNKQFGFEGKNVLTLSDIIGRSLDGTKGGERGLGLEGKGALASTSLDPLSFTAKMTPQQEQAIRALLDIKDSRLAGDLTGKAANLDTHAVQRTTEMLGKNEPVTKVETNVKAELANKAEQKVDAKQEPTAKELAAAKELAGKELPGKELAGKPDLTGKSEMIGKDMGLKTELGVKGELIGKGELAGKQDGVVRPDQIIRPDSTKDKDDRSEKFEPHLPFGKHDNTIATNPDGSKKTKDEIDLAEKKQDEKERLEEDQQRREAALLALIADRKIRDDKEKQQKEQDKLQQEKKQQDEDSRRRRYVVRERDTLESIASKQHRDGKLAPLIYDLNKKEIAMKTENGREVPDLRARQVIWLPSGVDIREFRKRASGSLSQSSGGEKLTAEDELSARFGANWGGTTSGVDTEGSGENSIAAAPELSPEVVAAAQSRRANIEKLLGPLSKQKPVDGRIRYVVRLGDTLKSVAMKHPSLQDISLWPLLAEVNEMSIETDDRGTPLARLSRGSTVMIPAIEEVQLYRDQHGSKGNSTSRATKPCPHCGRASSIGASICGACAHSFNLDSKPAGPPSDAGMVVMQAAGFVQKPGVPLARRPVAPVTVDLEIAPVVPAPLYPEGSQLAVVQLDEQTRLTRCMMDGETPSTVVVIEVCRDDSWKAVVAYEIFSQSSMRHEYNPRGERKSVKIDLPTEAILELSNNDLKSNWKNYRDRYFAQLISLNR